MIENDGNTMYLVELDEKNGRITEVVKGISELSRFCLETLRRRFNDGYYGNPTTVDKQIEALKDLKEKISLEKSAFERWKHRDHSDLTEMEFDAVNAAYKKKAQENQREYLESKEEVYFIAKVRALLSMPMKEAVAATIKSRSWNTSTKNDGTRNRSVSFSKPLSVHLLEERAYAEYEGFKYSLI